MAGWLGVSPAQLRVVSEHLGEVSARVGEVLVSLRAGVGGVGAVWGDDELGDGFAGGGGGFVAQREFVDAVVEALARGRLDFYARMLRGAADAFERDDEG